MSRAITDTEGMFAAAAGLPEQARRAVEIAGAIALPTVTDVRHIAVCGMGGSGIAGDILAAVAAPVAPVPVSVHKGYDLPVAVGAGSLVFAVSHSGDTAETLAAVHAASERGATVVAVTSGGALAELAGTGGYAVVPIPAGGQPRANVASLSLPLIAVCGRLGLLPGADDAIADALGRLDAVVPTLTVDAAAATNPARKLATRLNGRFPLFWGSEGIGAVAAYRAKCQVNENAKAPAFWNSLSEADHNEVCGWGQHGDITRQLITLVELRHPLESDAIRRRFDATRELVEECVAEVRELRAEATTPLGVFFDLCAQIDFTALYLAAEGDVDPGPVEVIARLKAVLAQ